MRKASTPVVIILVLLVIISLSVAGGGFYLFQKEKTKGIELEQKLEDLNTKQRITEEKLKDSGKLIADLQSKLDDAKSKIDTLTDDFNKEMTARKDALGQLQQLKTDLEEQKGFRFDLEKKLNRAQEDLRKTVAHLKELDAKREELETKIKDLEEKSKQIELGKIVVSPETAETQAPEVTAPATVPAAAPAAAPTPETQPAKAKEPVKETNPKTPQAAGMEGKVLVINKDYNFVVINLGSKDGVRIGDLFSIYHNDKYAGDIKVEKVHDSMAAAGFVASDIKDKISEGDRVAQKVK